MKKENQFMNPSSSGSVAYLDNLRQFVDKSVRVVLVSPTAASAAETTVEAKLCAVDALGLIVANADAIPQKGLLLYPWSAIRYVHLTDNVDAFRKAA